jgi:hypothetical protein
MMNLRQLAESDLAITLEDSVSGFGWDITVTDPTFKTADITGQSDDIAQLVDPDTGAAVSGRLASIGLRISTLDAKGLGLPKGISDPKKKPWVIKFNDINGKPYTFKVIQSNPDRALGVVTCLLEAYKC